MTDESKIVLGQDPRIYIWRKRGEGWRPNLVEARRAKPCFAVMIWGCITWHWVGTITAVEGNSNAQKYQQILDDNLWPVIAQRFPYDQYIFQDDNAPVHRSRSTQEFIHRNGIATMSWPSQSPDINIIENIWLYIKRKRQGGVGRTENKEICSMKFIQFGRPLHLNMSGVCINRFIGGYNMSFGRKFILQSIK